MKSSKLYYYSKDLSEKELEGFQLYLSNPLFCPATRLREMFLKFRKHVLLAGERAMARQAFFEVCSQGDYDDGNFRKDLSILVGYLLDYLALTRLHGNRQQLSLRILQEMNIRGLTDYADEYAKRIEKSMAEFGQMDMNYHFLRLELFTQLNRHVIRKPRKKNPHFFDQILHELDLHHKTRLLKHGTAFANFSHILKPGQVPDLVNLATDIIASSPDTSSLLVRAYALAYLVFQGSHEIATTCYKDLKSLLRKDHNRFTHLEASELYGLLRNFAIRKQNQGSTEFVEEASNLYEELLGVGYLFPEGRLSHSDYKNTMTIFIRAKNFKRASTFRMDYESKCTSQPLGSYYHGLIEYYNERYASAKRIFLRMDHENTDQFYKIDALLYLCKCIYHTEEPIEFEGALMKFSRSLSSNSHIAIASKIVYGKFIHWALKFARILSDRSQDFIENVRLLHEEMRATVEPNETTYHLRWLMCELEAQATKSTLSGSL